MLTEMIHPDYNKIVIDTDNVSSIHVIHGSFGFTKAKTFFTRTEYYKSVSYEPYKIIFGDKRGDKLLSFTCGKQDRMFAYGSHDSAFLENFGDDDIKHYQLQLANSKEKMEEMWEWITTKVFDVNKVYFNGPNTSTV